MKKRRKIERIILITHLPRSSVFDSVDERSFDCLDRAAGVGSCIDANVGIMRPRCTTKPVCKRFVSEKIYVKTKPNHK